MTKPKTIYDVLDPTQIVQPFVSQWDFNRAEPTDGETWTELIYGDSHLYPGQDLDPLQIVQAVAQDLQPHGITHIGDLMDVNRPKAFPNDPALDHTLQEEINMGRAHLAAMSEASPLSRRHFLEGNHEDRLRRLLWGLKDGAEVLNELEDIRAAATWPSLLHLDEIGWDFTSYQDQPVRDGLPKFLLKHGTVIRKHSAYTARAELDTYRRSGASGHSHRLGMHMASDHNGNHMWVETGCTCSTQSWYGNQRDVDWQQGFVVITFDPETAAPAPEFVYIHKGKAVFRENIYKAT